MPNSAGVEVARISVKVSPNTKEFRRELKAELEDIERTLKAKVDVEPNMGNFRKEVEGKTKGMRTSVKVDADVDKGFLSRITKKLDGIGMPSFGSGINPAGYAVIAAGVLATLTPLIGVISTALLALPGLLAAVLAPIGAITLGLDGIKKAAGVLQKPFEDLKKTMSDVNERAFTPVFEQLGKVFPVLGRALPAVSDGLAAMATSVVKAVTDSPKLENSINNIAAALQKAAPGVGKFTDGLLGLVESFTGKPLAGIADWFTKAGDSFSKWVEKMTRPSWFTGKTPLEEAFGGLGDTLKIVLDLIGDIANKGIEFMSDPSKIENFKKDLQGIADLLRTIVDLSDKFSSIKVPEWANINPLKSKEQRDSGKKQDPWLGGSVGKAMDSFETWIDNAFNVNYVRDKFDGLFKDMKFLGDGPDFSGWAEKMKAPFVTAFNWIKEQIAGVGEWFVGVGDSISGAFSGAWDGVVGAAQTAWSTVVGVVQGAIANVQGVVSGVGAFISGIWNGIVSAAQGAWNGVVGAVQSAWEGIKGAVSAGIEAVIGFVSGMGGRIVGAITSIDLSGAGKALMDGLLGGIKAGAEAVYNFVSGIASKIAALKGPISYDKVVLIPNGEALMDGLHTGINNGLQDVLATAKDVAAQIKKAMEDGTDGAGILGNVKADDLKQMLAALEEEKKRIKTQYNAIPKTDKEGRKALQSQLDQLQAQKDLLSYQRDRIKNEKQFSATADDDPLVKAASGLMKSPVDFAKATGKQFLSDLGISGDGLISRAITEGIQYVFNIGSVDEALSIKDREDSKSALPLIGR